MSDLQDAISALKAADKAGNVDDARKLAGIVDRLSKIEPEGSAMDTASQFAYGANEKIADTLATPERAAGFITEPLIKGIRSLTGGEYRGPENRGPGPGPVESFLRSGPQPQTGGERIARRVGEEVGATLPLAALPFLGAAARTGLPTSAAPSLAGTMAKGIRNTPGTAATGELAATLGSGTGAGVAQEAAPGNRWAEVGGQLAGGMAPTVLANTPMALGGRLARHVMERLSPASQQRHAQQEIAKVIGPEMTPVADANLTEAEALRKAMPGFDPTLAEATGSPGLSATQRAIESKASGRELESMAARRSSSEAAVERFASKHAPKGPASPSFVIDEASKRINVLRGEVAKPERTITQRQQEVAGALPKVDRSAAGETIRGRLHDIRGQASIKMSQLADDLGINDVDVTVPFGKLRNEIVEEFSPKSVFDDAANTPEVLDAIKRISPVGRDPATGQVTQQTVKFSDLKALRERLTDDILDAQSSSNPSRKKVRNLVALKEKVNATMDSVADDLDPALSDKYRQFRETYFKEYIEPFEKGAAFKVRQKDGRGFYRIPDEKVAEAFFAPGDVSGARQFKTVFGNDKEAKAALEAVALDGLRDAAVRDGTVNQTLLKTWMRRHDSVLSEFPEINRTAESLDKLTTALATRQAQLTERTRSIEGSILAKELSRVDGGSKTPEALIDAALKDPRKMVQLTGRLRGNDEAMNALRRTVWDKAIASGGNLESFIGQNRSALSTVFSSGHLNDLQRVARARQMLDNVPPPKGAGYSPNPLKDVEDAIGMGVPQIASRFFAAESGRTSFRYIATDALGRFIRGRSKAQSEALLKEALYDHTVARDLAAMSFSKGERPEIARRLYVRLFNLGMGTDERDE